MADAPIASGLAPPRALAPTTSRLARSVASASRSSFTGWPPTGSGPIDSPLADDAEADKRLVITMIDARQVAELNFAQLRDRSEEAALTRFDAEPRTAPYEPRTIVGTYLTDRDARSVRFRNRTRYDGSKLRSSSSSSTVRVNQPRRTSASGISRSWSSRAFFSRERAPVRWTCNTSPGGELERNFGAEHKTGRRHGVST